MNFVVAVDGSAVVDRTLDHALSMLEPLGATVTIIHTVEPQALIEDGGGLVVDVVRTSDRIVAESLEDAESRVGHTLNAVTERAVDASADAATELLYGDPVETTPIYADETDADGIFVGHRGLSERYGGLVGNVTKELVKWMPCPVIVVR